MVRVFGGLLVGFREVSTQPFASLTCWLNQLQRKGVRVLALVVEPDFPVAAGDHRRVVGDHQHGDAFPDLVQDLADGVAGGRVPREYIPSVDAGVQDAMLTGVLAGYPMVDIKATLIDGAYHEVDSSEMAFKIAGSMAFKEGAKKASPVLLEPVMAVEVRTPEEYMGDVIGDLNSRRGMIASMEDAVGVKVIRANVPLSEMFGYVGDLRSKTQGRAVYSMTFDSYAEVPKNVADEIIAKVRGA